MDVDFACGSRQQFCGRSQTGNQGEIFRGTMSDPVLSGAAASSGSGGSYDQRRAVWDTWRNDAAICSWQHMEHRYHYAACFCRSWVQSISAKRNRRTEKWRKPPENNRMYADRKFAAFDPFTGHFWSRRYPHPAISCHYCDEQFQNPGDFFTALGCFVCSTVSWHGLWGTGIGVFRSWDLQRTTPARKKEKVEMQPVRRHA